MSRKRRVFRAKVALASARGDETTAQLSAMSAVHVSQVGPSLVRPIGIGRAARSNQYRWFPPQPARVYNGPY
jgi:hypothetical protein